MEVSELSNFLAGEANACSCRTRTLFCGPFTSIFIIVHIWEEQGEGGGREEGGRIEVRMEGEEREGSQLINSCNTCTMYTHSQPIGVYKLMVNCSNLFSSGY